MELQSARFTALGIVATRQLTMLFRSPIRVLFGFTQPLIYVVFFGPFFSGLFRDSGPARLSGLALLVPGLLLQLTVFSAGFSGYAMLQERREGVIDRQLVSAAGPGALLLGRAVANGLVTVAQAVLVTVVSIPFGFRFDIAGSMVGLVILFTLNVGVAAASSALAYRLVDETTFTPVVQNTALPLVILSGVILPLSAAPVWLQDVAVFNPFSHAVSALREAFAGHFGSADLWTGFAISAALSAALMVTAVWSFVRAGD